MSSMTDPHPEPVRPEPRPLDPMGPDPMWPDPMWPDPMWPDPMWEVFVRARRGTSHVHVGSVHAAGREQALQNARDLFTRRGEGVSLWVVRSTDIVASDPDDAAALFEPALDKTFRFPTAHPLPAAVDHM